MCKRSFPTARPTSTPTANSPPISSVTITLIPRTLTPGAQVITRRIKITSRGLLYYLATSTNVPANVRTNMQSWGYAKDEFQDNGGWPYQCTSAKPAAWSAITSCSNRMRTAPRVATDPICAGQLHAGFATPSRALAVGGVTVAEGGIGAAVPYPYPRQLPLDHSQASANAKIYFRTFALSASHVGFASIRMEPVFMMTSQSARHRGRVCH